MSKFDLIFGYALAFSLLGLLQASIASLVTLGLLGVTVMGGTLPVLVVAVAAAFLGTALGLLVSAFATSEFQAVQLVMPILMPQVLLCGLFVARDHMARPLQWLADFLPLTYSVDAMKQVTLNASVTTVLRRDLVVVLGCGNFGISPRLSHDTTPGITVARRLPPQNDVTLYSLRRDETPGSDSTGAYVVWLVY